MTAHKLLLAIALLAIGSGIDGAKVKAPATVYLRKCCPLGQNLDAAQKCVFGGMDKWVPPILMVSRGLVFSPPGEAPRFFRVLEAIRPVNCSVPLELFTSQIVLSSNGSLYVQELDKSFGPLQFCVDKDAAIVCNPPPLVFDVAGQAGAIASADDALNTIGSDGEQPLRIPADVPSNMLHTAGIVRASGDAVPARRARLHKCCGPRFVYDRNLTYCVPLTEDSAHLQRLVTNASAAQVDLVFGFPRCQQDGHTLVEPFRDEYFDRSSGAVRLPLDGRKFEAANFCVEHTVRDQLYGDVHVFACAEHFALQEPEWATTGGGDKEDIRYVLLSIGLFISVVFLTATLATAFLLPSSHHVLHWRCQTFYVACLLVGDLLLAITQMSRNGLPQPFCSIIAYGMHFFFLAAFFWLNTMCFNIWWTFRDFRPTSLEKSQELLRLRIYQVYAWGVPLIIASVAAILDNLPAGAAGTDVPFLRPRFGEKSCWFYGDIEIFTYFFGPIGVLLIINFMLFASTARQLTCGLWKRDDVKSTTERSALGRVCLKLVVVMGVTWVADVLSWAVGGPRYFWYLTDVVNALQGVLIFVVVGCQPQVWTAVKRLWSLKTGRGDTMNTTNGAQNSSSSHGLPSIGESVTNHTNVTHSSTMTASQNGSAAAPQKMPMETIC